MLVKNQLVPLEQDRDKMKINYKKQVVEYSTTCLFQRLQNKFCPYLSFVQTFLDLNPFDF